MFYTYAHINPNGSIFYIGKGTGVRAWKKTKRNPYWKNIVSKYKAYDVKILASWDTEEEALSHEILLISCFREMGYKLANMTDGGEGTSGHKHTAEWKQKASIFNSGKNNWAFGKPKPKAVRQKISKTKIKQKLRGTNCHNFKCSVIATNIKTNEQIKLTGTAEMESMGFQNSNIFKCLNGERKSHKGYTFKRLQN